MMADAPHTATPSLSQAAAGNLRYIRATMDASGAFTCVPGAGIVLVGIIGVLAGLAVTLGPFAESWLLFWLGAAAIAAPVGAALLARKAASSGTTLASGVGRRFLFALLPGFVAAAFLTAALVQAGLLTVVPAAWLLLYGASVSAAGALSVLAVRLLGMTCMALGALSLAAPASFAQVALLAGFGLAHIGFGGWIWRQHGG